MQFKTLKILHSQSYLFKLLRTLIIFVLALSLFTIIMMKIENLSLSDAIWLSLTTSATVGYGDLYAQTVYGRVATFILIYIVGIALLAKMAGDYFSYITEKRENIKMGRVSYESKLKNHVVIVNVPDIDTVKYLEVMKHQIENSKNLKNRDIIILSTEFENGLPQELNGIKYVNGSGIKCKDLEKCNIQEADYIFIFGEYVEDDSSTIMTLLNINKIGTSARIISEFTDLDGKDLLLQNGCHNVIRQVRAYPELIVRIADSPGSEGVFENLFDINGETIHSVKNNKEQTWKELCTEFLHENKGIPLGVTINGETIHSVKNNKEQTWKELCTEFLHENKGIPLGATINVPNQSSEIKLNPINSLVIKEGSEIFIMSSN